MTIIQHFPRNASVSIGAGTYTGTWVETFDAITAGPSGAQAAPNGGAPPGTHYNGVTTLPNRFGLSFAKSFVGQSFTDTTEEFVSGTASNPLTLQAGPANQNVVIVNAGGAFGQVIAAQSTGQPYPNATYLGSGSFAVIWPTLQSAVRFDITGGDGQAPYFESIRVEFYRSDGSLITFISQTTPVGPGSSATYQFVTTPSSAIIKGVRISNNAYGQFVGVGGAGGFGIDNIHWTP